MSITESSLILDCRVNLDDYHLYWLDRLKRDLPNTLIFWGTMAASSLFVAFLFRNDKFGFTVFIVFAFIILSIPILLTLYSYSSFMSASRRYISSLSDAEKNFQLIFKNDGSGFDCVYGENFSHISWKSVTEAIEKNDYFVLMLHRQPLIFSKSDFKNVEEVMFFRNLLSENITSKTKFLEN
jgi:hypothetical protein